MVKVTTPGLTSESRCEAHLITDTVSLKTKLSNAADKIKSQSSENASTQHTNCVRRDATDPDCDRKPDNVISNHVGSCDVKNDVIKDAGVTKSEIGFENPAVRDKGVKIQISVSEERDGSVTIPRTVSLTDVTKPLTIETKFGGSSGPSSESTDTASEVGSVFSSPGSLHTPSPCQGSPQLAAEGGGTAGGCWFKGKRGNGIYIVMKCR